MTQSDKFYEIMKHLTETEGGVLTPAGASGKEKVINAGIAMGLLAPNTDPKKSSFSAGKLGPFFNKGIMKYLSDGKTVVVTGVPYSAGQLLKDPTWGVILSALKEVTESSDRKLVEDFVKTRNTMPVVSREDFVKTFFDFQHQTILGRDITRYGKELHIVHLVGAAISGDCRDTDLRHGDGVLGTPDLNAAMSHFNVSYFGEVSIVREPVGLVAHIENCSAHFSVKNFDVLANYRPFFVKNSDGVDTNLCALLTNATKVQLLLIKFKAKIVDYLDQ